MKLIDSGAEAVIYEDSDIVKDRVEKPYRIPQIDLELRKTRTRRESKILKKLESAGFPAPRLIETDRISVIRMSLIKGKKLRDALEAMDYAALAAEVGKKIALLHNMGIIHGDLTTSNMILEDEVYLIDFGLSFFSEKVEDKAVDLHLFRQALESKHYKVWKECFDAALESYKRDALDATEVLLRLEKVEARGRNKGKSKGQDA